MKKVIFRNITLVSAIFIVTFSIMLITNYFQVRQSSPLQTEIIESLKELNIQKILRRASKNWDGGYAMAGLIGHGDAFVVRDPWGIRPAHYYCDDEIAVIASERPVIQTVMNVHADDVKEISPGEAIIIRKDGLGKKWCLVLATVHQLMGPLLHYIPEHSCPISCLIWKTKKHGTDRCGITTRHCL